jgi:hypothetical protein
MMKTTQKEEASEQNATYRDAVAVSSDDILRLSAMTKQELKDMIDDLVVDIKANAFVRAKISRTYSRVKRANHAELVNIASYFQTFK